jgi:hypothetical protein
MEALSSYRSHLAETGSIDAEDEICDATSPGTRDPARGPRPRVLHRGAGDRIGDDRADGRPFDLHARLESSVAVGTLDDRYRPDARPGDQHGPPGIRLAGRGDAVAA